MGIDMRQNNYDPRGGDNFYPPSNQQPPKKSSTGAIIIAISVVLCIAIVAGTAVFLTVVMKDKNKSDTDASSSDATVAAQEDNAAADNVDQADDGSSETILYNTLCKEYVTLRSSTSMESPPVTTIPKGETVEVVNTVLDSTFIHVRYNGEEGYVLSAFFTESQDPGDKYVMYCGARSYANLRSQPGSNNAYNIDTILTNEPVQCTGSYEYVDGQKYLEVVFKDQTGYVLAEVMNYDQKGSTYKGN